MRSPTRSPPKSPQNRAFNAMYAMQPCLLLVRPIDFRYSDSINSNVTAVNSREGTQLAEATPQVDFPQRIDAPESVRGCVYFLSVITMRIRRRIDVACAWGDAPDQNARERLSSNERETYPKDSVLTPRNSAAHIEDADPHIV